MRRCDDDEDDEDTSMRPSIENARRRTNSKSTTTLTIHSLFAPPLLCRFTEGQKIVGVPHVAPTMSLSKRVMCVKCVT